MKTHGRRSVIGSLVVGMSLALAACGEASIPTAPPGNLRQSPPASPTPATAAPTLAPSATSSALPEPAPTVPPVAPSAVPTGVPTVETPAPSAASPAAPPQVADARRAVAVLSALSYIGGRDFHALAGEIAKASKVNPLWLSLARNTLTVVDGAPWPDKAAPHAELLAGSLQDIVTALEADDLAGAASGAESAHDADHELGETTYEWLAEAATDATTDADTATASVLVSTGVIDLASFHDLAIEVEEATEPNPLWTRTATRSLTALNVTAWPTPVASQAETVGGALHAFLDAVSAGDLGAAAVAAAGLHDAEHALSDASYGWLTERHPGMAHDDGNLSFACLLRAVDAVERVDFHDLAKEIAEGSQIDPGVVAGLGELLAVLDFDAEDGVSGTIRAPIADLRDALERGDRTSAVDAAEKAHDVTHDFMEAAFERMADMPGGGMPGH